MTKRYHSQDEICHLFVEQSPDCTRADLRSGNLTFEGPTLTSFGWWPLAHWTGRTVQERRGNGSWASTAVTTTSEEIITKRVLLRNAERHRSTGWNSDGHQQTILSRALRGREDCVTISVGYDLLKAYLKNVATANEWDHDHRFWNDKIEAYETAPATPDLAQEMRDAAWRKLGEELIYQEIASLKAKAKARAKPYVYAYLGGGDDSGDIGSDVSRDARINDLSTKDIEERAAEFGIVHPTHMDVVLDEAREIVRQGYAAWNDPVKVAARARDISRGALTKLRQLVSEAFDGKYRRNSYRRPSLLGDERYNGPNEMARDIIAAAFKDHPIDAARILGRLTEKLVRYEQLNAEKVHYPDAAQVVEARRYGGKTKYITPDEWCDGENGRIEQGYGNHDGRYQTYVRRENAGTTHDEVATSLGARIPFKDAVKLYLAAARAKVVAYDIDAGEDWNGLPTDWSRATHGESGVGSQFKAGFYVVNSIDRDGNCKVGCHRLCFTEMERLAVKEVPHLVTARYPVPSLYIKRDALDMVFGYANGGE